MISGQVNNKNIWISGNAMSWALGVTLSMLLGIILLIAMPRMLGGKPAATTEAGSTSAAASAEATDSKPAEATASAALAATGESAGAGDVAAGKEKFVGTCAGCHGANAEGAVGPALKPAGSWTLEQFTAAVREGKAPEKTLGAMMPHFGTDQLSDADVANLHAFVQSLN